MRAKVGRRVADGVLPIVEVRLTSNGMQTAWLVSEVGQDEQMLLLRHFKDQHLVPGLEGRGRAQRVVREPGVPGRADHLHAALGALRPPYVVLEVGGEDPFGRDLLVTPQGLRVRMDPAGLPASWSIGRHVGGDPVLLCDLRRGADGAVVIERRQHEMTDLDAAILIAHFGLARWAHIGGERGGALVTAVQYEVPGTVEHFVSAMFALPTPYVRLPQGGSTTTRTP